MIRCADYVIPTNGRYAKHLSIEPSSTGPQNGPVPVASENALTNRHSLDRLRASLRRNQRSLGDTRCFLADDRHRLGNPAALIEALHSRR